MKKKLTTTTKRDKIAIKTRNSYFSQGLISRVFYLFSLSEYKDDLKRILSVLRFRSRPNSS